MYIDFLYYMKVLAVATITFIIYRLLILENKEKTKDHYTRPAWNFFLKKMYAEYVLNKNKKRQLKFIKELRKYESETPKLLPNEDSTDSQKIFGTDHDGNSLLIKFIRRKHRIAEIWMILRLKCDNKFETYTLPDHPHTKIPNAHPNMFEGSGLKIECLVPYSRWRITYAGMLRKGISQTLSDDESDFQFVKLNLIWTAASNPSFWPYEWNTGLIASALATEKWRDGKWSSLINLNDAGGYDQFGACRGQVRIYEKNYDAYMEGLLPKAEIKELNLPGLRKRRWGPHKNENVHRTGVIIGSMKDGTVLEVGAFSSKIGVTHSQFGSVRNCNGDVMPIKWTDFHLASLGEYQDKLPQATIVQIKAGDHSFIAVVTFKNNEKVPLFGGYVGEKWNAFVVPVDIVCNCVRGYGVAVFWYPRNIRHFEYEDIPTKIKRIFNRNDLPSPEKQILSFADKEAQSVLVSGGKGCSLATLRRIQESKGGDLLDPRSRSFHVFNALVDNLSTPALRRSMRAKQLMESEQPRTGRQRSGSITKTIFHDPNDVDTPDFFVAQGFVVSVSAFDEHVKNNVEISNALKEMEDIAYEKTVGSLEEACKKVQIAFTSTKIDDKLKEAMIPKLEQINYDLQARFAVRSSGVTEDAEELSAAGQNQTFLGLKTNEEVFEAIVKCWASLFSFQSTLYRKQNIQPVNSSMAVVVQKMVVAESAGVLFSRHFLSGDPSVIVITANFGLGESVVSAKSEPDTYLIKQNYKGDEFKLLAAIPGDKKYIIEMDDSSAVTETELDEENRKKLCLSEDTVLRLAKLSTILEKFFGSPRDIEFAITKDKRIFLLQSRAITALNNFTDYEIAHETDSAVMGSYDIYTRANVGEVLSGAISKLSNSLITEKFEQKNLEMLGVLYSPLYRKIYATFNDTIFMEAYNQFLKTMGNEPSVMNKAMSFSVFGGDIFEQYPNLMEIMGHRNTFTNKFKAGMGQMKFMAYSMYTIDKYRKYPIKALEKMKIRLSEQSLLKYKTSSEILDLVIQEIKNYAIIIDAHMYVSSYSAIYNAFIFSVLTKGSKELTTEHQRDVTLILGTIGNVESANIPEMIQQLAESIKASGKENELLEVDNQSCPEWLETNDIESYNLFKKFMERHGHRALKEFDLISKTWEMEPEKVIEMIKTNLRISPNTSSNNSSEVDIEDIIDKLKTPITNLSRRLLRFMIVRCRNGVQYRETAKSMLIECVNELRRGVIHLSQKMVHEGLLPDKDLIYHLSVQEIRAVIKNKEVSLIQKAIRRRKMIEVHNQFLFEEICFGLPKPMSDINDPVQIEEGDILVKGMPVCSGRVTARACVIKNFSEIHKLQKGDILITFCTDIAWSPYFNVISGICTEIGGLISHGAVVARECNLPCIVGAKWATDKIKHGDKITLDADIGTIIRAI
ncbi:hypothetical protein ACKWTF_008613 [Chironomus riparius]